MEFHVTQNEKQNIQQIPNIKLSLSKAITSKPYDGEDIEITAPDGANELAQIKIQLRNKVDRAELENINNSENTRQVNEQSRQNHYTQAVIDESKRLSSEEERKQNEATRSVEFKKMSDNIKNTMDDTKKYVASLQQSLMSYIDNSVITNEQIDDMINNALRE